MITQLLDHTYYAVIRVRQDGELIEIDSRPSDAIALSVHYDPFLPIYVSEDVLDEAMLPVGVGLIEHAREEDQQAVPPSVRVGLKVEGPHRRARRQRTASELGRHAN